MNVFLNTSTNLNVLSVPSFLCSSCFSVSFKKGKVVCEQSIYCCIKNSTELMDE